MKRLKSLLIALAAVILCSLAVEAQSPGFPPNNPGPLPMQNSNMGPSAPPAQVPGFPVPPGQGPPTPASPATPPPGQVPPGQTPPPPGWASPGILSAPPIDNTFNSGTMNVMATGYDSQGVMKQIPLFISYNYNGVNYNVTVLNSWNPYTQMWTSNVDTPAYQTSYFLNGFTYNYYAVLPTGTFYFNL